MAVLEVQNKKKHIQEKYNLKIKIILAVLVNNTNQMKATMTHGVTCFIMS